MKEYLATEEMMELNSKMAIYEMAADKYCMVPFRRKTTETYIKKHVDCRNKLWNLVYNTYPELKGLSLRLNAIQHRIEIIER